MSLTVISIKVGFPKSVRQDCVYMKVKSVGRAAQPFSERLTKLEVRGTLPRGEATAYSWFDDGTHKGA